MKPFVAKLLHLNIRFNKIEMTVFKGISLFNKVFFLRYFVTFLILITHINSSFAQQERNELKAAKYRIMRDIAYTNSLLIEIDKNTQTSLEQLKLIKNKNISRKKLIKTISQELKIIDKTIKKSTLFIDSLENKLNKLRTEYSKLIYYAYKNKSAYSKLMFIFSAETFNQSYKRLRYLQQYTEYRKEQGKKLLALQNKQKEEIVRLKTEQNEKKKLLEEKRKEEVILKKEVKKQKEILKILQEKNEKLHEQLAEQKNAAEKFETSVADAVTKDITIAALSAKQQIEEKEEIFDCSNFEKQKKKLPWPTMSGVVTKFFGIRQHAVLKEVKVRNNGISISTQKGTLIRVVYNGIVAKIITLPNNTIAILIRHDDYYTLYSNLSSIYVGEGEKVSQNQRLGVVFTNSKNKTFLNFQIWHKHKKLNPILWLKGRKQKRKP